PQARACAAFCPPSLHDALPISGVRRAISNTAAYALWLGALVLVLPTIATVALTYMRTFWRRAFRVVLFLPNIISLATAGVIWLRSEEHTSELQSRENLVCRLLL